MREIGIFLVVVVGLGSPACRHAPSDPPEIEVAADATTGEDVPSVPPAPPSAPDASAAPPISAASIRWERRRLAAASVALDFFAEAAVEEVVWPTGGGTLFQALRLGKGDVLRLAMRAEPDEGLDAFRRDHQDWTFGSVEPTTICGRPAEILRASRPSQHITCVMTPEGNHPAYIPPRQAVALVFEHRGRKVRVTWEAESEDHGALTELLAHFLASPRCD